RSRSPQVLTSGRSHWLIAESKGGNAPCFAQRVGATVLAKNARSLRTADPITLRELSRWLLEQQFAIRLPERARSEERRVGKSGVQRCALPISFEIAAGTDQWPKPLADRGI